MPTSRPTCHMTCNSQSTHKTSSTKLNNTRNACITYHDISNVHMQTRLSLQSIHKAVRDSRLCPCPVITRPTRQPIKLPAASCGQVVITQAGGDRSLVNDDCHSATVHVYAPLRKNMTSFTMCLTVPSLLQLC